MLGLLRPASAGGYDGCMRISNRGWLIAILSCFAIAPAARADSPAVLRSEFIAEQMPTPSCHASTIVETGGGLVAAWFGGKGEGDPSVGIWLSRMEGEKWSAPVEVANGVVQGQRYPAWNPVLFQPSKGPLMLFYKVGPSPSKWWGMLKTSDDAGKTWGTATKLPEGILGPIKDKPVQLSDGTILCPSSSEQEGWRLHMEFTKDLGKTWEKTGPLNDGKKLAAIQPTILFLPGGQLELLARSKGAGMVLMATSKDQGRTWSDLSATALPNPNSAIDAVTLKDGRHLLAYNHTPKGRSPLNIAISSDGTNWKNALTLESDPGEYSYPATIQAADGKVHVTYTWKRAKVKHVVIDAGKLE